jgi:hypothetical protein
MKDQSISNNIKRELKKSKIKPISIYSMDSGDEMAIIRVKGKKEDLNKFFDPENIWSEEENEIGNQIYPDKKEWYIKLKNGDPRLPGIKEMMVDQQVGEILKYNKKRGEILLELKKKWIRTGDHL